MDANFGIYTRQFVLPSKERTAAISLINDLHPLNAVIVEMNTVGLIVRIKETEKDTTLRFIPWAQVYHIEVIAEKATSPR